MATALQAAGAAECSLGTVWSGVAWVELRAAVGVAHGLVPAADAKAVASTDGLFAGLSLGVHLGLSSSERAR